MPHPVIGYLMERCLHETDRRSRTVAELAAATGAAPTTVYDSLRRLMRLRLVTRHRARCTRPWNGPGTGSPPYRYRRRPPRT